jgi:hypothetical protein
MKSSFPFAALALLVTVCASLLVCADAERWRQQYGWLSEDWPWRLLAVFGGAALFGAIVGIGFMFASRASWRVRFMAPIAGILAGQIGILLLIAPGPIWRTIFAVSILVGTAVLFRLGAE